MPAINIAREMVDLNSEIRPCFLGRKNGMEREIVERFGFEIEEIDIVGMRRSPAGMVKFAFKWFSGYAQAKRILVGYKPLAVVGTGGYVSAPAVRAAHKKGIPVYLQEQNSLPGLASRTLGKYARIIFIAYESAGRYLQIEKCRLVGNPIGRDIPEADRTGSYDRFGLDPGKGTLLVLGGSSGARGINDAVLTLIENKKIPDDWQVLWQTGKKEYESFNRPAAPMGGAVKIMDFIYDMPAAYAVADLIVSRAGAMAISEITAAGRPSILIPYPHATGDHQTLNAKSLEGSGAAIVIKESEIRVRFENAVGSLFADPEKRKQMSEKSRLLGRPEAARAIAKAILENINEI
jgi:UDP-N-acetylglucosamine--N-acetylmuramyl-(pentapeptide) pyrophosphoryl-undecaprenol N-acetylglucosamine transferase